MTGTALRNQFPLLSSDGGGSSCDRSIIGPPPSGIGPPIIGMPPIGYPPTDGPLHPLQSGPPCITGPPWNTGADATGALAIGGMVTRAENDDGAHVPPPHGAHRHRHSD